ncbi:hypothetical protein Tco_0427831 [Tanacetum coccineum]
MGCHYYNPHEYKVYVARHAELFENSLKCTRSEWESHSSKVSGSSVVDPATERLTHRESNAVQRLTWGRSVLLTQHCLVMNSGNDRNIRQFGNQSTKTVVGARKTVGNQVELEAHYMYMEKIQEVLAVDFGPTYDVEPLEKVQSNDDYNVFSNERQHSEQPESINDTYVVETVIVRHSNS